jgi:hypothetical protein
MTVGSTLLQKPEQSGRTAVSAGEAGTATGRDEARPADACVAVKATPFLQTLRRAECCEMVTVTPNSNGVSKEVVGPFIYL